MTCERAWGGVYRVKETAFYQQAKVIATHRKSKVDCSYFYESFSDILASSCSYRRNAIVLSLYS
jgi:hypothetical protein